MKKQEFVKGLRVWGVVELVDIEPPKSIEQQTFVLAHSATEGLKIVGDDERRRVISVSELCPLSQLPSDKYRPVEVQHGKLRERV